MIFLLVTGALLVWDLDHPERFWMVLTSFKTDADAVKPEHLIWFTPTLENYLNMTENYDYWRFARNSVITAVFATAFTLIVGIPCAYAMAFNPSRSTKDVLMWMLSTKMLPAAAVLYPMTFITKSAGLFDTHFLIIMVLSLINLPIVVWMLFTYFKEIPKDIIEAGQMDGVNTWGEIKEILIPLAWGGIPRLVREIGPALTKELVMTCRPFGAEEAMAAGFLNRIVAADDLTSAADELAGAVASRPRAAVLATKRHVNAVTDQMVGTGRSWSDADGLTVALRDPEGRASRDAYLERMQARKKNRG